MSQEQVSCRFVSGDSRVRIRELTGFDEQCVRDSTTTTAIELLDRVIEPGSASWRPAVLNASDRDRLLAAVYRLTYGARVESTSNCTSCGSLFDLSFSLDDLMSAVDRSSSLGAAEAVSDGVFRSRGGAHFRLPTGEDEMAVALLPPEEAELALFERCLIEAPVGADVRDEVEEAIEDIAPVVDLDIDTSCPECGVAQAVRFDVQYYLLRALMQERRLTAREIHRIATAYGWPLADILGLRRSERRMYVELIESEVSRRRLQ